jgi:hypothetical protein
VPGTSKLQIGASSVQHVGIARFQAPLDVRGASPLMVVSRVAFQSADEISEQHVCQQLIVVDQVLRQEGLQPAVIDDRDEITDVRHHGTNRTQGANTAWCLTAHDANL